MELRNSSKSYFRAELFRLEPMITHPDFDFSFEPSACKTCGGKCCVGESAYVWVTAEEIDRIAQFLNLTGEEFCEYAVSREGDLFTLNEVVREDDSFACIYFDEQKMCCSIYQVRPNQCRTFPFWDEYTILKDGPFLSCPGIVGNEY